MKFPSIEKVAIQLRLINQKVDGECDVRLQVYEDGTWIVHYGDSSYDQDHRGFWGAGSVPGVVNLKVQRFDTRALAKELLEQVKAHYAESKVVDEAFEEHNNNKALP